MCLFVALFRKISKTIRIVTLDRCRMVVAFASILFALALDQHGKIILYLLISQDLGSGTLA